MGGRRYIISICVGFFPHNKHDILQGVESTTQIPNGTRQFTTGKHFHLWTNLRGHLVFVSSSFSFETLLRHEGLSFNTRLKLILFKSPLPVRRSAGCFINIISLVFMIPLPGSVILPSLGMRKVWVKKHKH